MVGQSNKTVGEQFGVLSHIHQSKNSTRAPTIFRPQWSVKQTTPMWNHAAPTKNRVNTMAMSPTAEKRSDIAPLAFPGGVGLTAGAAVGLGVS
jgi:hypothetical protein